MPRVIVLWILLLLASCNKTAGIDGSGRPNNNAVMAAKVTAIGAVTVDEDTLYLNGEDYDISNTTISINGEVAVVANISDGQVAVVNASIGDKNIVNSLSLNSLLVGQIEQVEGTEHLRVLGQTIILESLAPEYRSDIAVGDVMEVYGFSLANGDIVATLLTPVDTAEFKVVGAVSQLNEFEGTLMINDLAVDYSAVSVSLALDDTVEVVGQVNQLGQLVATSVERVSIDLGGLNDRADIQGYITDFRSLSDFEVNGIQIVSDNATEFVGGDARQLFFDNKIEVEGIVDDAGLLVAQRIIFLKSSLLNPIVGQPLSADKVMFQWSDVDADEYYLRLYSSDRTIYSGYYPSGTTEVLVDNLPINGASISATLRTRIGQHWESNRYSFESKNVLANAQILSPIDQATIEADSMVVMWSDVGASEYHVLVKSRQTVIADRRFTQGQTETTIDNLPANTAELTIQIRTRHSNGWGYESIAVTGRNGLANAELTSHVNRSSLAGASILLAWQDVAADEYRVTISSQGPFYSQFFSADVQQITVNDLPINGAPLVLTVYTRHGQGWGRHHYTLFAADLLKNAELLTPVDRHLVSDEVTFSWDDVGADEYQLIIKSEGVAIHNQTYGSHIQSVVVNNLPKNSASLAVEVRTRHGNGWGRQSGTFTSIAILENAQLQSHVSGQTLTNDIEYLQWNDVGADEYRLYIIHDGKVIYDRYLTQQTKLFELDPLPIINKSLTIRLYTRHHQGWAYESYSFTR